MSSRLFTPLKVGNAQLQHRIAMAPMTRYRADDNHVPTDMMVTYYSQRASTPGTLIVTEGTFISKEAGGFDNVPGIYNEAQIAGWKKITDAVHKKGSFIFCQLWSLGRAANPAVAAKEGGYRILAPSAIAIKDESVYTTPEAMTVEEIQTMVQSYATAAKNALKAGFDGVEIHGANGYIIDQFLQDVSNHRTDAYGGSIANRSRFAVEVVDAVVAAVGAQHMGIRFSPWSDYQDMRMSEPIPQFTDVIGRIRHHGLAYLHMVQWVQLFGADRAELEGESIDFAVEMWDGPVLVAGRLTPKSARELVEDRYPGKEVVAVFGRPFVSTPDLPWRVKQGMELNPWDLGTMFTPKTAKGYTDAEFSPEFEKVYGSSV